MKAKKSQLEKEWQDQEEARLKDLYDLRILDTADEDSFDQLIQIAAALFEVPFAAISLIDKERQWFKAKVGFDAKETSREIAFCSHTVETDDVMVVSDAQLDPRFANNPMVMGGAGIRFYAGAPLITSRHNRIGAICVIDQKPRHISENQVKLLQLLSKQIVDKIEYKKLGRMLRDKHRELQKVHTELKIANDFLGHVTANLPLGLVCKDVKNGFSIRIWNKIIAEGTRIPSEKIIGHVESEFLPVETAQLISQTDREVVAKGHAVTSEEIFENTPGGRRYLRTHRVPLKNTQGETEFLLNVVEDITEIKEAQCKLLQSSKMSSLGEMASGIAHEINNPLAIIRGRAQLLKEMSTNGKLTPEIAAVCAQKIDETSVRIAKIISGLRNFAREGSVDPFQPSSLKEIVENAEELCRAQFKNHGIGFFVESIPQQFQFECRSVQIIQVLVNLISNAIDAVSNAPERTIRLQFHDLGSEFEMRLVDSGPGIPASIKDRIMQPFFTTKDVGKGTGLGLSISKGIIEAHQGTLTLDTKVSQTCFAIRLPKAISKLKKAG